MIIILSAFTGKIEMRMQTGYYNKKPPCRIPNGIQRTRQTRGTTSIYRDLTTTAFSSVSQHSCSVTGAPVAAYLIARSVHCSQDEFDPDIPIASQQPATLSRFCRDVLVPVQSHLFCDIFYHFTRVKSRG